MRNFTFLFAFFFALSVFAIPGNGTKIQPNLCGYTKATEFMNLIQEEWWLHELEKLMPEQMAGMMKSVKNVSLKVKVIPVEDTSTIIEIPKLYQQLLKIRESAALISAEKAETGQKLVAHIDKIIAIVNK